MEKIVTVIEQRPNYFRGQLLLEDDFLAEQNYHINARERHNAYLHGWGIVRGLTVSRANANSIVISPGYAIDETGHEILLKEARQVDLEEFGAGETLRVSLAFEGAGGSEEAAQPQKKRDCLASLIVSRASEEFQGLTLATIQLDSEGHVSKEQVDYSETRYVRILSAGSITAAELHESLKTGWLRLPFRAFPLVNPPEGETDIPPAFRVGTTESLSPDPKGAGEKDRGAAGTMAIPVPANAKQVVRLRIAGSQNSGGIVVRLFRCGWDPISMTHVKNSLLDESIKPSASGPFLEEFKIKDTALDPEYQSLSVWVRGEKRTAISLIAAEFVYY